MRRKGSMEDTKNLTGNIREELQALTSSVADVIQTLRKLREPVIESGNQPRVIDRVESISGMMAEIIQDISLLRKTLPATYFKNRSKIRDTINSLDIKAQRNLENASKTLNNLRVQNSGSHEFEQAVELMEEIEQRLLNFMEVHGD
jgi:dsDNA-specific endonuclease/ATPase MutS2